MDRSKLAKKIEAEAASVLAATNLAAKSSYTKYDPSAPLASRLVAETKSSAQLLEAEAKSLIEREALVAKSLAEVAAMKKGQQAQALAQDKASYTAAQAELRAHYLEIERLSLANSANIRSSVKLATSAAKASTFTPYFPGYSSESVVDANRTKDSTYRAKDLEATKQFIETSKTTQMEALRKSFTEIEVLVAKNHGDTIQAEIRYGSEKVAALKAGKAAELAAIIEGQKAIDAANNRLGRGVAPLVPAAALPIAQAAMTQAGASPAAHAAATAALTESQAVAAVRNAEAQAAATARIAPAHSQAAQAARDHAAATATVHTSYTGLNREANAFFRGAVQGFGMLSNSMVSIIPMMLGFGVASAFMKTLKVGSEFEQSMFVIQELAGTTSEKMVEIRTRLLEIGASTQYGPIEAAKGLETLSLAGLSANSALTALVPTMHFAAAGGVTMAAAAETLVAVGTAFHYTASSFELIGDLIAKTAADTMSSVTNMAEAFKTSSVLAQQYGITLQDTAAALGMLANIGITGTAAGTAWRNMITEFNKDTGKAAFGIKAMGVEMHNLDGSTKPIMEVMEGMSKFLITLDSKSQMKMLQDITNERGAKATAGFQAKVLENLNKTNPLLQEQVNYYNSVGEKAKAVALAQEAVTVSFKELADKQAESQAGATGVTFFANLQEQMLPAKQMSGILASLETDFQKAFSNSADSVSNFGNSLRKELNSAEFQSSLNSITGALVTFVGTILNATAYVIKHGEAIISFVGSLAIAAAGFYAATLAISAYSAVMSLSVAASAAFVGPMMTLSAAVTLFAARTAIATVATAAFNAVLAMNPFVLAAMLIGLTYITQKTLDLNSATEQAIVKEKELAKQRRESIKAITDTTASQMEQMGTEITSVQSKIEAKVENIVLEEKAQKLEREAFELKKANGDGWQAKYKALTDEAKVIRSGQVTDEELAAKAYGESMQAKIDALGKLTQAELDHARAAAKSNLYATSFFRVTTKDVEAIDASFNIQQNMAEDANEKLKSDVKTRTDALVSSKKILGALAEEERKLATSKIVGADTYEGKKKKEFTREPRLEQTKLDTSNELAELAKRSALVLGMEKSHLDNSRLILKAGLDAKEIDAGAFAARDLQLTIDSESNSLKVLQDSAKEEQRLHDVDSAAKQKSLSDFMEKNASSTKGYEIGLANLQMQAKNANNTFETLKQKNLAEEFKLGEAAAARFAAQLATVVGETKEAKKAADLFFKEDSRNIAKTDAAAKLEETLRYVNPEMAAGIKAQATEWNRVNDLVYAQSKITEQLTKEQVSQTKEVGDAVKLMEDKKAILESTSSTDKVAYEAAAAAYAAADISAVQQNSLLETRNGKLAQSVAYEDQLATYRGTASAEAAIKARELADKAYNANLTVGVADALIEGMTNGAASGAKKFRDVIVAELRKPITLMIQAMVNPVVSAVTSAMGLGAANATGLASGASSGAGVIGSLFPEATAAISGFTNAAVAGVQTMAGVTGTTAQMVTSLTNAGYSGTAAAAGGAAAGSAFAAAVPYIGAAVLAYSLLTQDHGKPTENTGSAARAFDIKGNLTGTETYYGGSSIGADAMIAKMQTAYMKGAESLGITMAASNFNYSGNTGKNGEAPNFALGGGAGGKSFQQTETPLDQTSIDLAASRAVFAALQGSTLPAHLAGVFDTITASTVTQAEITDAIAGAQALATWHEQLKALPFAQLTNSSYAAMQNLLAAAGGIDKFSTNLQGYYANFYTAEEKTATLTKSTQKAFEDLGLVMPALDGSTRANYRAMVEELGAKDLSVVANAKAYTSVLALQDAVSQLSPAIEDVSKTILGFDAAGLSKMMLDAAFNPTAGMTAAQSFGAALEYSIQSTLINSAMGSIATSIYNSIVMPIATGVAVSQAVTDGVIADAKAKMEALATLFKSDSFKGALAGISEAVAQIMPSVTPLASSYVAPAAPVAVTADTAAADAKANLTAKLALEAQLAALTKDTAEAERVLAAQRQMSIADLNAQDTSGELAKLTKQLWSLEDAAKVTADALVQSNSVLALQSQIAELTKDTSLAEKVLAAQRQASVVELMKTDATGELATLTKELWKLQDAAKAAAAIATLTTAINSTLDKYQTPEQKLGRSYTTMAQDLLNAGLQGFTLDGLTSKLLSSTKENMAQFVREVFALEGVSVEAKTAVLGVASAFADVKDTSIASAKSVADLAYSALERAVTAQKAAITITRDLAQTQVTTLQSLFDLLKTNVSELYKEVKSTNSDASSRQFIDQALSTAQATGYLPELTAITDAISTVRGNMVETNYSTQFEMDRDRLILAGKLSALKDLTGTQLTTAEKALNTANDQLTALDDILTNNKKQLDAANGIDVSVISVEAAVQGVKTAISDLALALGSTAGETPAQKAEAAALLAQQQAAALAAKKAAVLAGTPVFDVPTKTTVVDQITAAATAANITPEMQLYQTATSSGYTAAQVDKSMGWAPGTSNAWAAEKGLPTFATGINFVPNDMVARIHEGEAVVPKAYNPFNPAAKSNANQSESSTASEIKNLREETRAQAFSQAQLNLRMVKVLERWENQGLPEVRVL